ncbi:winged helix-turn-helix domain-containing protein [Halobellus clavatus]|uniref:winged helix-turn-helix domain-containing protein n=1 Tax=Halobellus clavatus TaxID=660517 RepID=UPI000B7E58AF|nr:winged helix-turn-helix domain-containing protein [Halobellus clavatus]
MASESGDPEWLTELDRDILEVLSKGLVLTPSLIAENIDRSRTGVNQRLSSLQAGGLVKKVDRGKYKITEDGNKTIST